MEILGVSHSPIRLELFWFPAGRCNRLGAVFSNVFATPDWRPYRPHAANSSLDASAAEPTLIFKWQERGGPPVTPKRQGFGTVLLERAVATAGSPPHFDYSPEGFTYEVRAILTQQAQPT
jgi:hypothetical protein